MNSLTPQTLMRKKPLLLQIWHWVYFTYYFHIGYKLRIYKERAILLITQAKELYYVNQTGELIEVTWRNYEQHISVDLGESILMKHENYNTGEIKLYTGEYFGKRKKAHRAQTTYNLRTFH